MVILSGGARILFESLHQQNASLLAKKKMVVVSTPPPPTHLTSLLTTFLKQDLKERCFDDVAEVQGELLATLDSISIEDFRQCFQQREQPWDRCIQSQGDKSFKLV